MEIFFPQLFWCFWWASKKLEALQFIFRLEQARKLQATLVRNYESPTDWQGWSVEPQAQLKNV